MTFTANYSEDEVRAIVENYDELMFKKDKLWLLIRLADLEITMEKLPEKEREAIFLLGIVGFTIRQAEKASGVPHSTLWRRYNSGLRRLTRMINGKR